MNPSVIKVEVECCWFAFPEGERCCGFGGVGEAMQLGESEGAVGVFDVAKDAAGADRGELLIITDQPDAPTTTDHELHGGVEGDVSAIPASSMITKVDGPIRAAQSGRSP